MREIDTRVKLLSVMLLTIVLLLVDKISISVCMAISLFIFRILLNVPFKNIRFLKNLFLLAVFIILAQGFFGPGDKYIISSIFLDGRKIWFDLKWDGLILGLIITCRLFSLMMIFPLLSETSTGGELSQGVCALGVPYRIAFIISSAFNQVPRFSEDARMIMDAQKLRGFKIFEKKRGFKPVFFARLKAYAGICLPLIINAMRKAQSSSIAMDSRAFGVYKYRTWIDKPKMKAKDYLFITGCIIFCTLILFLNFYFA